MSNPVEIVQQIYVAFGAGDLPKIMSLLSDRCEWEFVGPASIVYCGRRRGHEQIQQFFAGVAAVDDTLAFEPREIIAGGNHVTVLGRERIKTKPAARTFETDWVHVFTIEAGKVVRFKGMYDTAASVAART